ncbi:hypothetical protein [Planctobacterium marinum]|uniref:Uncharacterized protein n=1 Tax=Planctobacterium marinum TaxID=1631968 RepID=A0AA48KVE3_9ALTE|nr:hypothetical protein MACH26_29510 [Planctobacterium marinum]
MINLKKLVSILLFSHLVSSTVSATAFTEEVFFTASTGQETLVSYKIENGEKSLVIHNKSSLSSEQILQEFAETALTGGHYNYVLVGPSCPDCAVDRSLTPVLRQELSYKLNDSAKDKGTVKVVSDFFSGVASSVGANTTNEFFDALSNPENSSEISDHGVIVVRERGGMITDACMMESGLCRDIPGTEFISLENGFSIKYPAPDYNDDLALLEERMMIQAALLRAVHELNTPRRYQCQTVYTGPTGDTSAQLICYSTD